MNAAAKGLGMSPMTLMKRLLEKQMPVILGNISKELYEQLLRQKNEYTDFDDFLSSFYKTTTGKQINVRLRQKYYMYARGFNF